MAQVTLWLLLGKEQLVPLLDTDKQCECVFLRDTLINTLLLVSDLVLVLQ